MSDVDEAIETAPARWFPVRVIVFDEDDDTTLLWNGVVGEPEQLLTLPTIPRAGRVLCLYADGTWADAT